MSYAEDLVKIRKRVLDAVALGVVDSQLKDFYPYTQENRRLQAADELSLVEIIIRIL